MIGLCSQIEVAAEAREEDTPSAGTGANQGGGEVRTRCRATWSEGGGGRSTSPATGADIDFDRPVSNADLLMPAMRWVQRHSVRILGRAKKEAPAEAGADDRPERPGHSRVRRRGRIRRPVDHDRGGEERSRSGRELRSREEEGPRLSDKTNVIPRPRIFKVSPLMPAMRGA
jgi:hypothetical protein